MKSDIFKSKWKRGRNKTKQRFVEITDNGIDKIEGKNRELLDLIEEDEYDYYPRKPKKR